MKRINLGAAALIGSVLGSFGMVRGGIERAASGTKRARQMNDVRPKRQRSKYMPHYGAKEQERARRCYMHYTFSTADSFHDPLRLRSAPVLHQRSKLVQEFHDAGISWF